jgi:hypothetical protein
MIGRGADADLLILDLPVSRRQAILTIDVGKAFVKKEGKLPVFLNGTDIAEKEAPLRSGDCLKIHETTLRFASALNDERMLLAPAICAEPTALGLDMSEDQRRAETPKQDIAVELLETDRLFWGLWERLLRMGRVEAVERLTEQRVTALQRQAEVGEAPRAGDALSFLHRLLKLASATRKDVWFGFIFDLARLWKHKMTAGFLDMLHAQIFICRPAISPKIVAYAQTIDDETISARLASMRRFCDEPPPQ